MPVSESQLIDAAVAVGLVSELRLRELRLAAKRERLRLLEVVARDGRFPDSAFYQALADQRKTLFIPAAELVVDRGVFDKLPRSVFQQRPLLPVRAADGQLLVAVGDPDDRASVERVERSAGCRCKLALAEPEALKAALAKAFKGKQGPAASSGSSADPVTMLDEIMKEVYLHRATDVHFEAVEGGMQIRLRVDGRMIELPRLLDHQDENALMNRIKVLAGLDITESRMAQDGAMKYQISNWNLPETDIRVATIPTRWGERATLRILGQETGDLSLEQLGMRPQMLDEFRKRIQLPYGMILVTGPTGSGKSTTLYSAIRELDIGNLNILTVEDPVEQTISGVSQVQVGTKVSFAQALRSFLRHDPDVVLVGEIRDQETADISMRAAMTGHLVLSTLHTNDAVGAVTRLADIGVERFLVGSTVVGVLAQRLVRRLCPHCRTSRNATELEVRMLGIDPAADGETRQLFEPQGCSFCLGSGYKGRLGIFEALWIDQNLARIIAQGADEDAIADQALSYTTLWDDCCAKVLAGDACLDAVLHLRPEEFL